MEKHLEKMINNCDGWWMMGDSHSHYYLYECLTQIKLLRAFSLFFKSMVSILVFGRKSTFQRKIFFSDGYDKICLAVFQKKPQKLLYLYAL